MPYGLQPMICIRNASTKTRTHRSDNKECEDKLSSQWLLDGVPRNPHNHGLPCYCYQHKECHCHCRYPPPPPPLPFLWNMRLLWLFVGNMKTTFKSDVTPCGRRVRENCYPPSRFKVQFKMPWAAYLFPLMPVFGREERKRRQMWRYDREEGVSSYWTTFRKGEGTGNWNSKG